jgi:hypothetical protein
MAQPSKQKGEKKTLHNIKEFFFAIILWWIVIERKGIDNQTGGNPFLLSLYDRFASILPLSFFFSFLLFRPVSLLASTQGL